MTCRINLHAWYTYLSKTVVFRWSIDTDKYEFSLFYGLAYIG